MAKKTGEHGTPATARGLGQQIHRAPRTLSSQGAAAKSIKATGRSIAAGCSTSTSFARAITLSPVKNSQQKAGKLCEEAFVGVHVDDVSHTSIGSRSAGVRFAAKEVAQSFSGEISNLGLHISSKSVAISNCPLLLQQVGRDLASQNLPVKTVLFTEGLGIAAKAGARRSTKTGEKRQAAAKSRAGRAKYLAAFESKAKQLYKTGVRPQQAYGGSAAGFSPAQRLRQKSQAAKIAAAAAAGCGTQLCSTTVVAHMLVQDADPEFAGQLEVIRNLCDLQNDFCRDGVAQAKLQKAWKLNLSEIVLGYEAAWAKASGPLAATQFVLIEAGWGPTSPWSWLAPGKRLRAEMGPTEAAPQIVEHFRGCAAEALWKKAAKHYAGGGLETGEPSLKGAQAAKQFLQNRGEYERKQGCWTQSSAEEPPREKGGPMQGRNGAFDAAACAGHAETQI